MIFFFGFGSKQKELGPGATRTCPRCGNTTVWARVKRYRQFTVFFVPLLRWRREQLETCTVCGTSVAV